MKIRLFITLLVLLICQVCFAGLTPSLSNEDKDALAEFKSRNITRWHPQPNDLILLARISSSSIDLLLVCPPYPPNKRMIELNSLLDKVAPSTPSLSDGTYIVRAKRYHSQFGAMSRSVSVPIGELIRSLRAYGWQVSGAVGVWAGESTNIAGKPVFALGRYQYFPMGAVTNSDVKVTASLDWVGWAGFVGFVIGLFEMFTAIYQQLRHLGLWIPLTTPLTEGQALLVRNLVFPRIISGWLIIALSLIVTFRWTSLWEMWSGPITYDTILVAVIFFIIVLPIGFLGRWGDAFSMLQIRHGYQTRQETLHSKRILRFFQISPIAIGLMALALCSWGATQGRHRLSNYLMSFQLAGATYLVACTPRSQRKDYKS